MTDITELAQLREELANDDVGSYDRLLGIALSLVEALEKAQQRNGELETYSKTAIEFREAARDENRHLKLELEIAEKRIAELESRTVTAKPPEPYAYLRENDGQIQISIGAERPSDRSGGYATPWFAIYTAVGIKGAE